MDARMKRMKMKYILGVVVIIGFEPGFRHYSYTCYMLHITHACVYIL